MWFSQVPSTASRRRHRWGTPVRSRKFVYIAAFCLLFVGCGDFSNTTLEEYITPPANTPAGPLETPPTPSTPETKSTPLTITPKAATLPEVRPGVPYSQQFSVLETPPIPVCWKLTNGHLPSGITLDRESGRLGGVAIPDDAGVFVFSVAAVFPCDSETPLYFGEARNLVLETTGRCDWDQDCAANERCSNDGVCRIDVASCPLPIGPTVRLEIPFPQITSGQLVTLYDATVVMHSIANPDIDGCEPNDHLLKLLSPPPTTSKHFDRGNAPLSLCYRLPGDSTMPVEVGEKIDIRAYFGTFGDRYAMIRPAGSTQGWRWALYSGNLDDAALWRSVCGSHKDCPFITKLAWVGLNGCVGTGVCGTAQQGIRIATQSKVLLPGQQTAWGTGPDGASLYSLLLADAFSYQSCAAGSMIGGLTYLLLEGNRPHPLITANKTEVFLKDIPTILTVDGASSIGVAPKTDESSYISKYEWNITVPDGNPRPGISKTSTVAQWKAYTAGEHIVHLGVFDYKTSQQSQHDAVTRITVRPQSAVHMELRWEDPGENVNLKLIPAQALESWAHPKYPPLWENSVPSWAVFEGQQAARIIAQPDGLPLELLQVDPAVIGPGKSVVAVEKSGGGQFPIRVWVRLYLYGKRIELPEIDNFVVRPGEVVPLVEWDIHNGTAARYQH
ncbi:MAG: hypothetical protein HUU55_04395 [Myxococcales bacterium]|nr:hypothetical protein [Myxococcales bacterium]